MPSTGRRAEIVDVVVVAYRTPELVVRCVGALLADDSACLGRIVVVDNSPDDEVGRALADAGLSKRVELVHRPDNPGFGAAVNVGTEATAPGDEYLVVLNADTAVLPGAIAALVQHLCEHDDTALVGPRLVDGTGEVQASVARFPTPWRVLLAQSGLWKVLTRLPGGMRSAPFAAPSVEMPVDWVLGAALGARRSALASVDGFDERYFLYFEEVDLARRLQQRGFRVDHVPSATVMHVGGASSAGRPSSTERCFYESLARYTRTHGRSGDLARLRAVTIAVSLGHLVASRGARPVWRRILRDATRGWRM